jgi:hypothetical protein
VDKRTGKFRLSRKALQNIEDIPTEFRMEKRESRPDDRRSDHRGDSRGGFGRRPDSRFDRRGDRPERRFDDHKKPESNKDDVMDFS